MKIYKKLKIDERIFFFSNILQMLILIELQLCKNMNMQDLMLVYRSFTLIFKEVLMLELKQENIK